MFTTHPVGPQFEHCLGIIRRASVELLMLLKLPVVEGKDLRWFLEQLEQARLNLGGWAAVAHHFNIDDGQLSEFMLQLRHLQQGMSAYEQGREATENQLIAAERFIVTLEHIKQQQPKLIFTTEQPDNVKQPQETALKKIRAIELMLRSLIAQTWPNATQLRRHLKSQFGAQAVVRWQSRSESNDILDGMSFSELALLIVDKKSFSRHYDSLFNSEAALTFMVEQRLTLHRFLDDIRRMRNTLLADQPLTDTECLLLESYTQQITTPVQRAYEQGRTAVNPADLLAVDDAEVQHFWAQIRSFTQHYGQDSQPIADSIEKRQRKNSQHSDARYNLISNILWGAVGGVIIAIIIGGGMILFNAFSSPTPVTAQQQAGSQDRAPISTDTPRSSSSALVQVSPREKLGQKGILWDQSSFRSAINRNDVNVVGLFLQGGMNWKLSWTEKAMSSQHDEVLKLLLHYRTEMDEPRACRRFIDTLAYQLKRGATLNTMMKTYLQTFCATPAVIDRQKLAVDRALQRNHAMKDVQSKKALAAQKMIYDVIKS